MQIIDMLSQTSSNTEHMLSGSSWCMLSVAELPHGQIARGKAARVAHDTFCRVMHGDLPMWSMLTAETCSQLS